MATVWCVRLLHMFAAGGSWESVARVVRGLEAQLREANLEEELLNHAHQIAQRLREARRGDVAMVGGPRVSKQGSPAARSGHASRHETAAGTAAGRQVRMGVAWERHAWHAERGMAHARGCSPAPRPPPGGTRTGAWRPAAKAKACERTSQQESRAMPWY